MPTSPTVAPTEPINAVAYRRAHAGKLMILMHASEREPVAADFFYVDSVGTHPTGLFVTGLFDNARRSHMISSTVREANEEEIALRNKLLETTEPANTTA